MARKPKGFGESEMKCAKILASPVGFDVQQARRIKAKAPQACRKFLDESTRMLGEAEKALSKDDILGATQMMRSGWINMGKFQQCSSGAGPAVTVPAKRGRKPKAAAAAPPAKKKSGRKGGRPVIPSGFAKGDKVVVTEKHKNIPTGSATVRGGCFGGKSISVRNDDTGQMGCVPVQKVQKT